MAARVAREGQTFVNDAVERHGALCLRSNAPCSKYGENNQSFHDISSPDCMLQLSSNLLTCYSRDEVSVTTKSPICRKPQAPVTLMRAEVDWTEDINRNPLF